MTDRYQPDSRPTKDWITGDTVTVGFLRLKIISVHAHPNKPDSFTLTSLDGKKQYKFIPPGNLTLIKKDI